MNVLQHAFASYFGIVWAVYEADAKPSFKAQRAKQLAQQTACAILDSKQVSTLRQGMAADSKGVVADWCVHNSFVCDI